MRLRFTIRDLFWLTALAAMAVTWWLDHKTLCRKMDSIENELFLSEHRIRSTDTHIEYGTLDNALIAPAPAVK